MSKNRLLVTALVGSLLAGTGYTAYNFLKNQQIKEPPSNERQTVATNEEAVVHDISQDKQFEALLAQGVSDKPGEYRIYVREITGDKQWAGYRADEKIIAASTYKLFLTYVILEEAEKNGSINLETPVGSGTVRSCIESLLVISSDACAFSLGNLVTWPVLDARLQAVGFTNTALNNYTETGDTVGNKYTTAHDEAILLQRLAEGTLLNKENSELMLGFMKQQIHRQRIAAGVPKGVTVASKPGWIYEIENDAGIIYGPNSTYIAVLLSDNSEPAVLAELSKLIYNYLHGT